MVSKKRREYIERYKTRTKTPMIKDDSYRNVIAISVPSYAHSGNIIEETSMIASYMYRIQDVLNIPSTCMESHVKKDKNDSIIIGVTISNTYDDILIEAQDMFMNYIDKVYGREYTILDTKDIRKVSKCKYIGLVDPVVSGTQNIDHGGML